MKSTRPIILWALIALPIVGIAAIGILRAQQPPVQPGVAAAPAVAAPPGAVLRAAPVVQVGAGLPSGTQAQAGLNFSQPSLVVQSATVVEVEDVELYELRQSAASLAQQADQLASQYAATEDAEQRGAIKTDLGKLLNSQFEAQQQIRERELANVEARVKKLRDLTQKRRDAQKTIVDERLDQLLREADGLGWAPPANAYDAVVAPQTFNSKPLGRSSIKVSDELSPRR